VKSTVGQGATFFFSLPIQTDHSKSSLKDLRTTVELWT